MRPLVTVIVPARNEEKCIEACVASILAQSVDGELEVVVVDGRSSDRTAALARRAGATVIDNPERITPTALNRGLAAARGRFVARLDAHSEMGPGYLRACLTALDEEAGAVNVGGWADVRGTGAWSTAVRSALQSRLGTGNPRLWRKPPPGSGRQDVETVPFGCFPAVALREAGGWNDALVRNQDFELNHRLRALGGRVVFDPDVWFVYRPRESPSALFRQYWTFGRWKAVVIIKDPGSLRPRQLAPLGLFATLAGAVAPSPIRGPARFALAAYGAVVARAAAASDGGWRTAPVLLLIHGAWGAGFLTELLEHGLTWNPRGARRVRPIDSDSGSET